MHVALEHMTVRGSQGGTVELAPGDPIPDFADWSPWTQHCLIDEKRVRWAPEGITGGELARAMPKKAVTPQPQRHTEAAAATTVMAPAAVTATLPAEVFEPEEPVAALAAEAIPGAAAVIKCDTCGRAGFKDAHGLKIHKNKAHKGA